MGIDHTGGGIAITAGITITAGTVITDRDFISDLGSLVRMAIDATIMTTIITAPAAEHMRKRNAAPANSGHSTGIPAGIRPIAATSAFALTCADGCVTCS